MIIFVVLIFIIVILIINNSGAKNKSNKKNNENESYPTKSKLNYKEIDFKEINNKTNPKINKSTKKIIKKNSTKKSFIKESPDKKLRSENKTSIEVKLNKKSLHGLLNIGENILYGNNHGILENSFLHINTIGPNKENQLWSGGYLTHADYLSCSKVDKESLIFKEVYKSSKNLSTKNPKYFYDGLPSNQQWRIYGDFLNEVAFIDIETTGLSADYDKITTVVIHSVKGTFAFINGFNLDELPNVLKQFKVLVSYNGKSFDIPFIKKYMNIKLDLPHLDLRHILSSLGFSGGLKSCEVQLDLPKRIGLKDVDGFMAVMLWDYYRKTKNELALETLLAYNFEDTVRLEWLMNEAFNRKVRGFKSNLNLIELRPIPINPFKANENILRKL